MKKILLSAFAIAALAVTPTMAEDVAITAQQLPKEAQTFLTANFAKNKVVVAMHDRDITDNDYSVRLDDGTKIEFTATGKWESVKNAAAKIPATIIPDGIQKYVKKNYPQSGIVKIERKRYGYEVELANDLDIKFNAQGQFIGFDD